MYYEAYDTALRATDFYFSSWLRVVEPWHQICSSRVFFLNEYAGSDASNRLQWLIIPAMAHNFYQSELKLYFYNAKCQSDSLDSERVEYFSFRQSDDVPALTIKSTLSTFIIL